MITTVPGFGRYIREILERLQFTNEKQMIYSALLQLTLQRNRKNMFSGEHKWVHQTVIIEEHNSQTFVEDAVCSSLGGKFKWRVHNLQT